MHQTQVSSTPLSLQALIKELSVFLYVLGAELKRLFAYRIQFWFEIIASSIVEVGVSVVVWRAVFDATGSKTIGEYSYNDMLVYVVVAIFSSYAVRGTGLGTFLRDIYEGVYTRYLVYPISVLSYKFALFFARTVISIVQLGLALLVLLATGLLQANGSISLYSILLGTLVLILGSWLYYLLIVTIESVAFWADQGWSLSYMMHIAILFFSGKMIPIDLFPHWFERIIEYSPFPLMVFAPTRIILGETSLFGPTLVGLAFWSTILLILARFVVGKGTRSYTGVGI